MENKNNRRRLGDLSKEELINIIYRKDDVHRRLSSRKRFLEKKVEELVLANRELKTELELYKEYVINLETNSQKVLLVQ